MYRRSIRSFFDRSCRKGNGSRFFSHEIRFRNSQLSVRLLRDRSDDLQSLTAASAQGDEGYDSLSMTQKAQWLEFKTLLAGYLLSTQGDRMCLAHGVENRCPFLDPSVLPLATSVNLKFGDSFDEKYILKQAFAGKLPSALLSRSKHPYRAPDAAPFLKAKPDYLELVQSEHEIGKIDVLDLAFCRQLVHKMMTQAISSFGQAENQAFIFLLSTVILHYRFIGRPGRVVNDIDALVVKVVDGRADPSVRQV